METLTKNYQPAEFRLENWQLGKLYFKNTKVNVMVYTPVISGIYGDSIQECVACGGSRIKFWKSKEFQYTENSKNQKFNIYRCSNCGSGFLNKPPHIKWLQSIYQYSGQALTKPITLDEVIAREVEFPNCKIDAERLAKNANRCNKTGNNLALDIGSGFGFYTQALKRLGYRTISINPGRYENEIFRQLNGEEPVSVMFEDFQYSEPFGVVMMSQVLEHILAPDDAIKKINGMLATGGVLACAVPNYDSFIVKLLGTRDNACLWVPKHVNYFTEKGLKFLFQRNGFRVVKTEQITRIPFNFLSRRLGLRGKVAVAFDTIVKLTQIPVVWLMNYLGLGIYINVYAVKK